MIFFPVSGGPALRSERGAPYSPSSREWSFRRYPRSASYPLAAELARANKWVT